MKKIDFNSLSLDKLYNIVTYCLKDKVIEFLYDSDDILVGYLGKHDVVFFDEVEKKILKCDKLQDILGE
jgi:hypothetical protein